MVPAARWLVVALLALAVCAPPTVLRSLPAEGSPVTATALAERVLASPDNGWTGEVRAQGSLSVPLTGSTFGGIARLLGQRTDLRVWWRDSKDWRVDRITPHRGDRPAAREERLDQVELRGHDGPHRHLLTDPAARRQRRRPVRAGRASAERCEAVRALPDPRAPRRRAQCRRVAARAGQPASTIARVDVWVDESSGVPLRVDVYGDRDSRQPTLTSEAVVFDPGPRRPIARSASSSRPTSTSSGVSPSTRWPAPTPSRRSSCRCGSSGSSVGAMPRSSAPSASTARARPPCSSYPCATTPPAACTSSCARSHPARETAEQRRARGRAAVGAAGAGRARQLPAHRDRHPGRPAASLGRPPRGTLRTFR